MTVPFALKFPKIWLGLTSPIRLKTIESLDGCRKRVVSPALILNERQSRIAKGDTFRSKCGPATCAAGVPLTTIIPGGLARSATSKTAATKAAVKRKIEDDNRNLLLDL